MQKGKNKLKGFGLIETLVACAILIIICGALLAINVVITRDTAFARSRTVAFNLAQEGIESIRQIRDSNLIDGLQTTNWNTFVCDQGTTPTLLRPQTSIGNRQIYNLKSGTFPACFGSTPRITLVPSSSAAGEAIQIGQITYQRKIHFLLSGVSPRVLSPGDVTDDNALRAIVEVSWSDSGRDHQIEVTELLTNWKRGF